MKDEVLLVQNIPFSYTRVGNGPHNVLLIPGAPGSFRTDFQEVLSHFNPNKFTLIGWDPPGYGKSGPLKRDVNFGYNERDAEKAHALMKKLNLLPYSILGWSDGGVTGIFQAYHQRKTGLVHKLVVWGVPLVVNDSLARIMEAIKVMPDVGKKQYLPVYGESRLDQLWTEHIKAKLLLNRKHEGSNGCDKILPHVKAPTLVIHGKNDMIVPKEQDQMVADGIPDSRFLLCENGGHDLHMKEFDWFKSKVEAFLLAD